MAERAGEQTAVTPHIQNARLAELLARINFTPLDKVVEDTTPYLIEGFISNSATIIAGDPKAGKTTGLNGKATALRNGWVVG